MMSKTPINVHPRATQGLMLALLLGLALLLLSYLRLATYVNTQAFDLPRLLARTLAEPLWQTRLGMNILLFALTQVLLHLAFGAGSWLLAVVSKRAWPAARPSRRQWVLLWFAAGSLWLLVANASGFPRSSLGRPYAFIGEIMPLGIPLHMILLVMLLLVMAATIATMLVRCIGWRRLAVGTAATTTLAVATGFLLRHAPAAPIAGNRPNVILLGIDSLRPDMVTSEHTPHMRAFLDASIQFDDAITPLARTFPSWVSILTGRHPHTTGAFMNLLPENMIQTGKTLPEQLRSAGYRTLYAIDEVRFSNVDASYGFDQTVMPIIGASDFVLTWFSDTPLSNVLVNSRLGGVLFPFQHANRAAFVTYRPDSFVRQVDQALEGPGPLFMALHLTLPHWPFEWADSKLPPPGGDTAAIMRWKYQNSTRRADQQFGDLLAALQRRGLLENAVVVALSDHGEAFGPDDGFLADAFPGADPSTIQQQYIGHGTSVFSPPQYRTVLGFRAFGSAISRFGAASRQAVPVSLLDIAPTVLDLLQVPVEEPLDGLSLLPILSGTSGATAQFDGRIRFTESEYNPTDFNIQAPSPSAVAQAVMVYKVDPNTDRLHVRQDMLGPILSTRQYAALLDNSLAAAVPLTGSVGAGRYRLVHVQLDGSPGAAHGDEARQERLRRALAGRFQVTFDQPP